MANPSTSCEAIRDVLLSNNYHQSLVIEDWDSTDEWRVDRQFFLRGPRLIESIAVSGEIHQAWEMGVHIAFPPIHGPSDPDRYRFEIADAVSALQEAWHEDTTLKADNFNVESSDPEFNPEAGFWEVLIVCRFDVSRSITV